MGLKDYLNNILSDINETTKEQDYETCEKDDAHIIIELQMECSNITLYLRKKFRRNN